VITAPKRYRRTDRQTNITVTSPRYAKHRTVKTRSPMLRSESAPGLKLFGREIIFEEFQRTDHSHAIS